MGRLNHDQEQLFYSFHLEEAVPQEHSIRKIAAVLDLSWVRSELAPFYPEMGRPSIDPELIIRMLIIGYVFAIRSERSICREVQVNLAYRWFCGLSIEDKIPDHSVFSRARHERFRESDMFRQVFERVVEACIAAGLVGGEGVRSRCEPDRGGRQQAAIDPRTGVEQGARSSWHQPRHEGVFGNSGRCGVWRGKRGAAEICLAVRSSRAMDRRDARASVLRLREQLSHRR